MKLKRILCAVLVVSAVFSCLMVCSAATPSYAPYYSYEINKEEESVAAPQGFIESETHNSLSLGLDTPLSSPQDMVVTDDAFYILDSGNSRIIELDANFKVNKIYDTFMDADGAQINFEGATGLDINKSGEFVVADMNNNRVLILEREGKLKTQILRPDAVLKNNDFPFQVSKVKCAEDGSIYLTVDSMNLGIFVFDENGSFDKFVANNPVVATADVIMNYIYRSFLTTEQIRNRVQSTPLKITNFCIGDNGFLYTVSQNADSVKQSGMVRCMNYTDSNIVSSEIVFGDLESADDGTKTLFKSVAIDENGNYVLLDAGRGKVFYYSDNGYLISVFGGLGDQRGTFRNPVEVRVKGDCIYVLDADKASVMVFRPTDYVNTFAKAISLLKERRFDESLEAWKEVNLLNSNSEYAYYGMGLVYDMQGDYKNAMKCFKLANNRTSYSNSFKEYRMQWMADNVWLIIAVIVLIFVAVFGIKLFFKKMRTTNGTAYSAMETKWLFPLYTMRHPIDGCEQFKTRNIASVPLSVGIIAVWFGAEMLSKYATGFIYNSGNDSFNPMAVLVGTVGLFTVFVAANWCVASFLEGKGTFKDITAAVSYALLPYIISRILIIPLTNILTENEAVFISIISTIGLIWSAVLLLGGLYAIHQYSFTKTLVSVFLTIIAMIIIVFVAVIFYSLLQQAYGFFESLYQEITL